METREELLKQYGTASNLNARITFHTRFATNPTPWWQWVFDQFDLPPDARVLELGAGPGDLWHKARARIPAGWQITLSDLSPGMLDAQRQALADGAGQFAHEVVDAQAIPFEDERFDAVIANHMLYHVQDQRQAVAEIHRVLKPGGVLYAATNGAAHLRELRELVERYAPGANLWERFFVMQTFTLENGADRLAQRFARVETRRQDNNLRVTEPEPLVAYVASAVDGERLPVERLPHFTDFVRVEIARAGGALPITRDSGMFVAHKQTE